MRVLEWIFNRVRGQGKGHEAQLGWVPRYDELNFEALDFSSEQFDKLMSVSQQEFKGELLSEADLYLDLYDHLPKELIFQRELLAGRVWEA